MSNNILHKSDITKASFLEQFEQEGYVIVAGVFDHDIINQVKPHLHTSIDFEAKTYHSNTHKDYGMLLACPIYGGPFLAVLENDFFFQPSNWILGESSIIWVYTSSCLPPQNTNYASRIHVDRPYFIDGFHEGVGTLILLDDFTEDNGATYFLPKSHKQGHEPDENYFYTHAQRWIAPKGSVIYFNLRLWHAGGINTTDNWRMALGIGMIRPYYKQRIDLPRAMHNVDLGNISDDVKQKLGFFAQPPLSIAEYYSNSAVLPSKQPSVWNKK